MANGSTALLDEMDKADLEVLEGIREAQEQQSVTVFKANIRTRLEADTACLIACNPKGGRLTNYPLVDQLPKNMDPTALSRMDLLFVIRDTPQADRDAAMADHILAIHKGEFDKPVVKPPVYPTDVVLRQIAWARTLRPRLNNEASEYIKKYYVELRKVAEQPDMPLPIGVRQLEALVRLAEAHAKARGDHKEATVDDARAAIEILKESFREAGAIDAATGLPDIDKFEGRLGKSEREQYEVVDSYFKERDPDGKGIPEHTAEEGLVKLGVREPLKMLEKLEERGLYARLGRIHDKAGRWRRVA
jgi:replicative DNA helicase Mcm